jgi:hypothetical protein
MVFAAPTDLELLERHAPIIRYTVGEYFLPVSIDAYLAHCQLLRRRASGGSDVVAEVGTLDRGRLVELAARGSDGRSLLLCSRRPTRREALVWRLSHDRPRFSGARRLGSVGVMSRVIDSAMRSSLLVRGTVARRSEVTAEVISREIAESHGHPYYGRVVKQSGYLVLQYWFFYAFNDWRSRVNGVNDHEADWENVTIYLADIEADTEADPTAGTDPSWVVFSAHDERGADLRRRWDDPDLTVIDGHPVVHAGLGSHSGAYLAGDYLVSVEPKRFRRVISATRTLARVLLPWTREKTSDDLRVPYIDYARGDGITVGDADRPWRCEVIDDDTPWVFRYAGLWGIDTDDPFGGERGPAGPRYERSGRVRASWADPVGWAALERISPTDSERRRVVAQRLVEIDDELDELDRSQRIARDRLRADVAAGAIGMEAPERAIVAMSADRTRLDDERRRLRDLLDGSEPVAGVHDHLSVRHLPLEPADTVRRRLLTVWAALSTPLLLVAVGLLVLPLGQSAVVVAGISLLVIFSIEALARRHWLSFVASVATSVVVAIVAAAIVTGLIAEWRLTVAAVAFTVAGAILVANLAELRRR